MTIIEELENAQNLTPVEQEVVFYILQHIDQIIHLNISDLAELTFTSNATIIRLCRKVGVSGYKEFKIQLVKDLERRRKEKIYVDMSVPFKGKENSREVMQRIAELSTETIATCYESLSSSDLEMVSLWIAKANNTYIYATGDTLISAISFSNRLLKLQKHTVIASEYGETLANTYNVTKDDVALFVSYSGKAIIEEKYLKVLKNSGCKMILITASHTNQGFDKVIHFPNKEADEGKIATYYSQIAINYIFNCIYSIIFANDYSHNYKLNNSASKAK